MPGTRPGIFFCLFHGLIILFGGHASPDVPLGLVHRQHVLHVPVEAAVQVFQPLGDILVHRALADAELLCRPAHGGLVFHNVLAALRRPVGDDAAFHKAPLASNVLDMYESEAFVSTGAWPHGTIRAHGSSLSLVLIKRLAHVRAVGG